MIVHKAVSIWIYLNIKSSNLWVFVCFCPIKTLEPLDRCASIFHWETLLYVYIYFKPHLYPGMYSIIIYTLSPTSTLQCSLCKYILQAPLLPCNVVYVNIYSKPHPYPAM